MPTTFLYCALVRCGGQTHTGLMINFPIYLSLPTLRSMTENVG
ncbi:hypothetical protein CWATWH8502_615 [Crocosphaera watsonii WH 8502]|uniref:Uncharacterized protein n=1 Tax=Crocosphaera watsonii WH 8502 TaxID=423474 RepID=T2I9K6_CROWT|nr:hypothetical protein CWATWH8502_615 [Crocosphaera watsonii WH 8502]